MAENVVDINAIKDISALNFGEHASLLQLLQKQADYQKLFRTKKK